MVILVVVVIVGFGRNSSKRRSSSVIIWWWYIRSKLRKRRMIGWWSWWSNSRWPWRSKGYFQSFSSWCGSCLLNISSGCFGCHGLWWTITGTDADSSIYLSFRVVVVRRHGFFCVCISECVWMWVIVPFPQPKTKLKTTKNMNRFSFFRGQKNTHTHSIQDAWTKYDHVEWLLKRTYRRNHDHSTSFVRTMTRFSSTSCSPYLEYYHVL